MIIVFNNLFSRDSCLFWERGGLVFIVRICYGSNVFRDSKE